MAGFDVLDEMEGVKTRKGGEHADKPSEGWEIEIVEAGMVKEEGGKGEGVVKEEGEVPEGEEGKKDIGKVEGLKHKGENKGSEADSKLREKKIQSI